MEGGEWRGSGVEGSQLATTFVFQALRMHLMHDLTRRLFKCLRRESLLRPLRSSARFILDVNLPLVEEPHVGSVKLEKFEVWRPDGSRYEAEAFPLMSREAPVSLSLTLVLWMTSVSRAYGTIPIISSNDLFFTSQALKRFS